MGKYVEKTGKTVQEAISLALEELNADKSSVEVEILEEGNKGLFGLIGNKVAKVRVTLKEILESDGDIASKFLFDVFERMNIHADIETIEGDETVSLHVTGKDIGIIIGRRGETLDSLQYLTSLVVNKGREDYKRVVVDIENYRKKREETLVKLASRLADRVEKYKRPVTLEPMNPYERRVIHSTLQNHSQVETYSTGEEPNRKVIIKLK